MAPRNRYSLVCAVYFVSHQARTYYLVSGTPEYVRAVEIIYY